MQVEVIAHYSRGQKDLYEGSDDDIRHQLLIAYPFLGSKYGHAAGLKVLLAGLNACQAFSVIIPKAGTLLKAEAPSRASISDQLGADPELDAYLAAAAFLAGKEPDSSALREARVEHDGDDEAIALHACGLHADEASRLALRGVLGASVLGKAEEVIEGPQDVKDCVAASPDGEAFAATVRAAAEKGEVTPIQLGGKHSRGTAVARDPETHQRILLKPGSGKQSSAAGMAETEASQSKREAAFYAAAKAMGLGHFVPEAHLLLVDGTEVAGLRLLPPPWRNMNQLRRADKAGPRRLLSIYFGGGDLHRLAAMLYILGETDAHSGNIMTAAGDIKLIDHGSAFAGSSFNPKDSKTYVPFCLRVMAPGNWKQLTPGQKYTTLPRLHSQSATSLGNWLHGLSADHIASAISRYGIDPAPSIARLRELQTSASHMSPDLAVNAVWTL